MIDRLEEKDAKNKFLHFHLIGRLEEKDAKKNFLWRSSFLTVPADDNTTTDRQMEIGPASFTCDAWSGVMTSDRAGVGRWIVSCRRQPGSYGQASLSSPLTVLERN